MFFTASKSPVRVENMKHQKQYSQVSKLILGVDDRRPLCPYSPYEALQ